MYKDLNSKQRDVMFSCLIMANHSENEWEFEGKIFKCKAGQFVTSLDSIAKNCGKDVKVQSVRTALLKLEKWQFLTNKSTKTGRLLTICKWGTYQQDEKPTNNEGNRDLTNSQQTANKDLTPNKNVKNVKKVKNEKYVHYLELVDDFIKKYKKNPEFTSGIHYYLRIIKSCPLETMSPFLTLISPTTPRRVNFI
jgi:DNA replication protein DnaD